MGRVSNTKKESSKVGQKKSSLFIENYLWEMEPIVDFPSFLANPADVPFLISKRNCEVLASIIGIVCVESPRLTSVIGCSWGIQSVFRPILFVYQKTGQPGNLLSFFLCRIYRLDKKQMGAFFCPLRSSDTVLFA